MTFDVEQWTGRTNLSFNGECPAAGFTPTATVDETCYYTFDSLQIPFTVSYRGKGEGQASLVGTVMSYQLTVTPQKALLLSSAVRAAFESEDGVPGASCDARMPKAALVDYGIPIKYLCAEYPGMVYTVTLDSHGITFNVVVNG